MEIIHGKAYDERGSRARATAITEFTVKLMCNVLYASRSIPQAEPRYNNCHAGH
jgi:hypothetical protein